MTIKPGDMIPNVTLKTMVNGTPQDITTEQIFANKKVVIFGVPGAYTPTCSSKHLPGFVAKAQEFAGKGVDTIACISVNDHFVMDAWGQAQKVGDKILMLADGTGAFAKATGTEFDFSGAGLGLRNKRYAMLVENKKVTALDLEESGGLTVSSADAFICKL
ncbi:MAG: peroxiredoxin [Alphaproteobacteria bacterium]|nr:peroxiredoxin [Alphaproteobacteria bacterium]